MSSYAFMPTCPTNIISAKNGIIQSKAINTIMLKNTMANVGSTVSHEVTSAAKRETRGQTDKDTSKVIHASTTTADAVKTVGFAPFARANVTQASIAYKNAVEALKPESVKKMTDVGMGLNPQVAFYKNAGTSDILRSYGSRAVAYEYRQGVISVSGDKYLPISNEGMPVADMKYVRDVSQRIRQYTAYEKTKNAHIIDPIANSDVRFHNVKNSWNVTKELIKNRHLQIDEDLRKAELAADRYSKAQSKLDATPKCLTSTVFRAATFAVQNTDTMHGYRIGEASYRGLKAADKYLLNPGLNIAYNLTSRTYNKILVAQTYKKLGHKPIAFSKVERAYRKANPINLKIDADVKKVESILGKKTMKRISFKNILQKSPIKQLPSRAIARANNAAVNKIFTTNSEMHQAIRTFSDLTLKKARGNITKAEFKTANIKVKNVVKAHAKQAVKNTINKIPKPKMLAPVKKVTSALAKPFKAVAKPFKIVNKGIKIAFKTVANTISKIMQKVSELLAKIGKALGTAAGYIALYIGIIVALMYIITLFAFLLDQIMNIFMMSDADKYAKKAKIIYATIEECHEDEVEYIKELSKEYSASDVEYINGTNENYKEVWCATSIMLQQDLNQFDTGKFLWIDGVGTKNLKRLVEENYKLTHKVTHRTYTYRDQDGSEHEALHIYVNVLRDEALCYENLSLYPKAEEDYEENPQVTIDESDWMSVVKGVKIAMSKIDPTLSERNYTNININGSNINVRYDQSGFVSACLRMYNSISSDLSTYELLTGTSIGKFTRFGMGSWSSLKEGDILIGDKGCAIYAYTIGNIHYMYDGSRAGVMYSTCIPEDYTREYQMVLRPNDPGSITEEFKYDEDDEYEFLRAKKQYPKFTNEPIIDPDTHNEEGALIVFKNDLLDIASNPGIFNKDTYDWVDLNFSDNDLSSFMGGGNDHIIFEDNDNPIYSVSSSDFVRYMYARHGIKFDFSDVRALMDFGDRDSSQPDYEAIETFLGALQTGDLIWYLQAESEAYPLVWDYVHEHDINIWNIQPDSVIVGSDNPVDQYTGIKIPIGAWLGHNAIPLIYMGNGQCIGYSENLLLRTNPNLDEYFLNEPGLYTYNIQELEFDRMWYICRPYGFTVKPIYGATMFFEGWTNNNIVDYMELLNDECWDTGSFDLSKYGEILEGFVDWTWYEDQSFVNSSTKWQFGFDKDHYLDLRDDLTEMVIKRYESIGILPSTSFSVAHVLSGGRTSEESLLYYNIYEMIADDTLTDGSAIRLHHTEYDEDGNPIATYYNYYMYDGYDEAWGSWIDQFIHTDVYVNSIEGGRKEISPDCWEFHDEMYHETQLTELLGMDIIDAKTYNAAMSIMDLESGNVFRYRESDKYLDYEENVDIRDTINEGTMWGNSAYHDSLVELDKLAKRRREAIENINILSPALIEKGYEISASDGDIDQSTYEEYCSEIKKLEGESDRLSSIDHHLGITTSMSVEAQNLATSAMSTCKQYSDEMYEKHFSYWLRDYFNRLPDRCEATKDPNTGEMMDGCVDDNGDGYCDNCTRRTGGDESESELRDKCQSETYPKEFLWIRIFWDGDNWMDTYAH